MSDGRGQHRPRDRSEENTMLNPFEDYAQLREGVRALCKGFKPEYWREIDEQQAF